MEIKPAQLSQHLKNQLSPIYFLYGDEPLQKTESLDAITAHCIKQNYERDTFFVERGFDWQAFSESTSSGSMFAQQSVMTLFFYNTPDSLGTKFLENYAAEPQKNTVLIILCPKLKAATKKKKWFLSLQKNGVTIASNPISLVNFRQWLKTQLQLRQIQLGEEAQQLFIRHTEGNLLAAKQALMQMTLLGEQNQASFNAEDISHIINDMARYDVFGLLDNALAGAAIEVRRQLRRLKNQGISVLPILGFAIRELRILCTCCDDIKRGTSLSSSLQSQGIWKSRANLMQQTLKRHSPNNLQGMLRLAQQVDLSAKGVGNVDEWHALERFLIKLADGRTII